MGCRPLFLFDAGEATELVPLKMLFVVHNYCYSLVAYLPIFFEDSDFSKSEIGILLAIPCLCTIIGPPVWSAIADVSHRHKEIHILCHITSAVLIFAIQFVQSFPLMCVTVFAAYCQMVPTLALLDLAAMKLTGRDQPPAMRCRLMFFLDAGEAKELVPLKLLFVAHYYCNSLIAYLSIFFEGKGFSTSKIGILLAIPCLCTLLGPPIWGAIADTLHLHKQVHVWCHITSAFLVFAIQFVDSFPLMCATIFLAYLQMMPTNAMLDLAAMKLTDRYGGDFGKQRLYGAFGYGVGGYICGMMTSAVGIDWCFTMMLGMSCVSLFVLVYYIPTGYGDGNEQSRHQGLLWNSAKVIARRPDVLVLFFVALVTGVSGGFIDSYLFLNVYDLSDDGATIVSVFVAVETLSEIPVFFLSNSMINRFGTALCIVIVIVAYFVRVIVYAYMVQPWYVVPLEMLHGVTYGLLAACLTTYMYAAAPKGAAGTMIGLLSAFQRGIGSGIASLVGGYIYDEYGARTMWKISGFGIVPVLFVLVGAFACLARCHEKATTEMQEQMEEHFVERVESPLAVNKSSVQ
ncbi:Major Facilitator Superfamily (MFS) [Phytophthora cinnamomi]|uniref:Major Facilitator Superfamily (MFS) n=1 Tax=Phytophthora cinnamomi TaxID=4785 RepID=UPI00355AB5BF|nr:Major Facilitator Superfamily (MFS) [Phytophthora cinnamomi]